MRFARTLVASWWRGPSARTAPKVSRQRFRGHICRCHQIGSPAPFPTFMLAGLIVSADLPLAERLLRAAVHESGDAVAALHFGLPLKEALIRENGSGSTRYHHGLGPELAESRAIVIFSGASAERDAFPLVDSCHDSRDLHNIDEMVERFNLTWGEFELGRLKFEAQFLVQRLRTRIHRVASALVQHRRLTADQIEQACQRQLCPCC